MSLLTGLKAFCSFPGATTVVPILYPFILISPFNAIIYTIIFCCVYFIPKNSMLNHTDREDGNGKRSSQRAALWSLVFYFAIMIPLTYLFIRGTCGTVSVMPGAGSPGGFYKFGSGGSSWQRF